MECDALHRLIRQVSLWNLSKRFQERKLWIQAKLTQRILLPVHPLLSWVTLIHQQEVIRTHIFTPVGTLYIEFSFFCALTTCQCWLQFLWKPRRFPNKAVTEYSMNTGNTIPYHSVWSSPGADQVNGLALRPNVSSLATLGFEPLTILLVI